MFPKQRGARCTGRYIEGVAFFFWATGFFVIFLAVFPLFCAATAASEVITAAAGSTTTAANAQSIAAMLSSFIVVSILATGDLTLEGVSPQINRDNC
ncbi:MAG TPA: hypothetical protein VHI72_00780 [Hyphomicrobiaceae bacterium]|nr:hypothetical protein [Hyphomicrobiaceae bacterium]